MTLDHQDTDISISSVFHVKLTEYGRACFASQPIPRDTQILVTGRPFGSVILHEVRNEVCANCFKYEFGTRQKIKIPSLASKAKNYKGSGLRFCSESCRDDWLKYDLEEELCTTYEILLEHYQMKAKTPKDEVEYKPEITLDLIEQNWENLGEWDREVSKMKATKLSNQIPYLNEDEYTAARFITSGLFSMYKNHQSTKLFNVLQSNELQKIQKFPVLLRSQSYIFKFLRILLPDYLQPFLSIETFRDLFGREYGNSFGIWQIIDSGSKENREYLGYLLFPEASFFNHSCQPNVLKQRKNDRMVFKTAKDIGKGEQLCIDYFNILEEPFESRQSTLSSNWFFQCACDRCLQESQK